MNTDFLQKVGLLALTNFLIILFAVFQFSKLGETPINNSIQERLVTVEAPQEIQQNSGANTSAVSNVEETPKKKTKAQELTQHSSKVDCWISYRGHIYDITSYFGKHPGGDAELAKYCGRDATKAFETKDKNPPKSHSAVAQNMLKDFLIE